MLLLLLDIRIRVVVVVWRAGRGRRVLMSNGEGKQGKARQDQARPGNDVVGGGGVRLHE